MGIFTALGDKLGAFATKGARGLLGSAEKEGGFEVGKFLFGSGQRRVIGTKVNLAAGRMTSVGGPETGRGIGGLAGAFLKQALPRFAIAEGIDQVLDTPWGDDLSGPARTGMSLASFGLKFGAYRHLARGAVGSVLGRAGYAMGNWNKFYDQYDYVSTKLGGAFTRGSLANKALGLGARGAAHAAMLPVKMAVGIPYAAMGTARLGARLLGDMAIPLGNPLKAASWRNVGAPLARMGGTSIGDILTPRLSTNPAVNRAAHKLRLVNKEGHAPMMYGMTALGMLAGGYAQVKRRGEAQQNWIPTERGYNPANYGRGIAAMRRGPAANYGPALTLMLHQNSSRKMS